MGRVYVTKDGQRYSVDESELGAATAEGFKPLTEAREYAQSASGQVDAGLQGLVRGATFGLSDAAMNKEQAKLLQEENPVTSTVANVAGSLAVPGAVAKGIGGAVKGTGFAATAGRAALEGSLFGLEPAVSESLLDDKPLTAELLAAHMLPAAAGGAVISGGIYGIGKGLSSAATVAAEAASSESMANLADKARAGVLKQQLANKTDLKKYGLNARWEDLVKWGDERGVFAGNSHASVMELAGREAEAAGEKMGQALQAVEEKMPAVEIARMPKNPVVEYVKTELADDLASPVRGPTAQKLVGQLEQLFQDPEVTWQKMGQLRTDWNQSLGATEATGVKRVVEKADAALKESIFKQMQTTGGDLVAQGYRDAQLDFANAMALKGVAAERAATPFGLGNVMVGSLASTAFGSGPGALFSVPLSAFASYAARNRGGYLVANALQKISEGKLLPKLAEQFASRISAISEMAPGALGPFQQAIASAAGEGTAALLGAHTTIANSPAGDDYLARIGLARPTPEATSIAAQKLAKLAQIEQARERFDAHIDTSLGRFMRGSGAPVAPAKLSAKDLNTVIDGLKKVLQDPRGLAENGHLEHAPGLTVESGRVALQAAQYLLSKAPQDPDAWKPPALRRPYTPAPADVQRFSRYVTAASDPGRLVEELASGHVHAETVEATKMLYPNTFAHIQQQVFVRLQSLKSPMAYEKKLALANVFGSQLLGLSPQHEMILQVAHESLRPAPQPSAPDGRQVVNQAKNMQTQAQRIEQRGQQ